MDPRKLYHDSRLNTRCPTCGGAQETRDHVPAKVFLDEPYPNNLAVVAMCEECNNDPSSDEQYLACALDCIISGSTDPAKLKRENVKRILTEQPPLRQMIAAACRDEGDGRLTWTLNRKRVDLVLLKIARGLVAYDLADPRVEEPDHFWVNALPNLSPEDRAYFEDVPEQDLWPEIGSRAFERDAVVVHFQVNGGDAQPLPLPHLPWIEIQPGRFRYATSYAEGLMVRMVLSEYLACEVRWD